MRNMKEFLLENISVPEALGVLGIKSGYHAAELKDAFRRASMKAHPDKGGTSELQQKVNAAYKLLGSRPMNVDPDTRGAKAAESTKWKEKRAGEALTRKQFAADFKSSIDEDVYTKYFESIYGEKFKTTITHRPSDQIHLVTELDGGTGMTKKFELFFSIEQARGNGLASPEGTFGIHASGIAYADGKKMLFNDIRWKNDSSGSVNKPENFFPKTKLMKDRTNHKFSKKDSFLLIPNEFERISGLKLAKTAAADGFIYRFPKERDIVAQLEFRRRTTMGMSYWSIGLFIGKDHSVQLSRGESFDIISDFIKDIASAMKRGNTSAYELSSWMKKQEKRVYPKD